MKNNLLVAFLVDNLQWMMASFILAFGFWMIAVLQNDPIQQREFNRTVPVEFLVDRQMILTETDTTVNVIVTVRAPRSVWDSLRLDQIYVVADVRELRAGNHRVELEGGLDETLHGDVVEIKPRFVDVHLEALASLRVPVRPVVASEPPSGYTYPTPTCDLVEVTAHGPANLLETVTATARLSLDQERNPVDLLATLSAVDARGRVITNIRLEPAEVECHIEIAQREGVSELSVVPAIDGFPPEGYIYQGYEFEPKTVVVTGSQTAIRELNGVINTEPISLTNATSSFERTVSVTLPSGVRLQGGEQPITVRVDIGTVPGSRQFNEVPVLVEGLATSLSAEVLPNRVTVFVVGPQPLLQALAEGDLRVAVNVGGLTTGTYQTSASATITTDSLTQNGIQITVQPAEIGVTISEIEQETEEAP